MLFRLHIPCKIALGSIVIRCFLMRADGQKCRGEVGGRCEGEGGRREGRLFVCQVDHLRPVALDTSIIHWPD